MGLIDNLRKRRRRNDPREEVRPLWHRVVGISREPEWYRDMGVADTLEGRFDMITMVLSIAVLRMEAAQGMEAQTTALTELFVEDMDGQLRESGVGDVVVGKHVGKLMSSLGGRLGSLREAFEAGNDQQLEDAVARNVTFGDQGDPAGLAEGLAHLRRQMFSLGDRHIVEGEIPRG